MKLPSLTKKLTTVIICLLPFIRGNTQQNIQNRYVKTGPVYFVNVEGKSAMLSVFVLKQENKSICSIRLYDLQNANILQQKEITSEGDITPEQVIGRLEDVLWVFIDSLTGYDVRTLEPVATETMIGLKNSFMKNNFSRYANSYLPDEAAQVMYITANDGQQYKLYPDLSMKPDDTVGDTAMEDDFSYEFAAEYKVNDRYQLKYALSNVDTFHQQLYILGSNEETGQVLSYYGTSIYNERDEMRMLTVIAYNVNGEKIDYSANKPFTSEKQYFKAGFLQKKFSVSAWHGSNGEKIILYGKDKMLSVALVDKAANEKWSVDTKQFTNNFIDYLIDDKYLVIWFEGKEDVFVSVDMSTGNAMQP